MELNENSDDEFEKIESEEQDQNTDTSTYDIISYGADYTLSVLYDKMSKMEVLVPNFQRKYVWNLKQASILVESFLLGLPVPGIFLSKEKPTEDLLVIDGQQRLVTCKAFRDEKFPITEDTFRLKGVHEKWDGKKYTELPPADRKRFDDSILRATIVQQVKPEKDNTSIYHIFQRLNTGGTILQNQEIRNSIYHGKFNDLLGQLNRNNVWREVYNIGAPNKRMKDEELILRFFSLYYNFENYTKPMNEFMSRFMDHHRNPNDDQLKKMKSLFLDTIQFVKENIGSRAFRPKGNINGSAFDSVMYTISKYKDQLKENIQENTFKLSEDEAYLKAITEGTTDPETIQLRFNITKRYLVNE
jgi:hypothetical protein